MKFASTDNYPSANLASSVPRDQVVLEDSPVVQRLSLSA